MGHMTWPRPVMDGLSSVGCDLHIQPVHQIWSLCDQPITNNEDYKNKNWLQFLFIVKAAVLKQQISKFYPQI